MYRILKLNESTKLEEKDTVQDYIDFCKDMNIEPKDRKSVDKYMNLFSRMYAQYNGLATLKAAKQQTETKLKEYLKESTTEEKFDAVEISRLGFNALLKFNFGTDSNGNNYIITQDGEEVKRFNANSDSEAYDKFMSYRDSALDESVEEHDLSKDLYGDEANKRTNEDQRAYEKYLQFARDIKDGKLDTVSLDSAKYLLKNAYIKAKGYYSFEPEEIDKRIAKDIPDLFGNELKESQKLTEAEDDEDIEDDIENEEEIEDIEDNQEETIDSEEDQEENPIEEESLLDTQLDELRDILIDLDDVRLYKIVSQDNDEFYILGKVSDNSNDVEMLVDTQPIDFEGKEDNEEEINPEDLKQKFQFVTLPLQFDQIKNMNPKYGEELETNHEEIMSYLMNLLIEQNPEAAEEHQEEEIKIKEPTEDEEYSEEIITDKEEEDEEE